MTKSHKIRLLVISAIFLPLIGLSLLSMHKDSEQRKLLLKQTEEGDRQYGNKLNNVQNVFNSFSRCREEARKNNSPTQLDAALRKCDDQVSDTMKNH